MFKIGQRVMIVRCACTECASSNPSACEWKRDNLMCTGKITSLWQTNPVRRWLISHDDPTRLHTACSEDELVLIEEEDP